MSFANSAETAVLEQVFKGTALPWNGNANLWLALFTTNPGETGAGTETTYGAYTRQAVVRSTGFTVSGNQVSNTNLVQFPQCSSGSQTITHVAVMDAVSGGNVLVFAALNTSIPVSTGIQPQFSANALQWTLD